MTRLFILFSLLSLVAFGQCGKTAINPLTGKLDCVGSSAWTDNGETLSTTRNVTMGATVSAANTAVPVPASLGNGSTDQTTAIQAIFDANQTSTIRFSRASGCYILSQLKVYSGQSIEATDASTCIKKKTTAWAGGTVTPLLIANDTSVALTDFQVRNITLDGNRAGQTGAAVGDGNGMIVWLTSPTRVALTDVVIQNAYTDGVYVTGYGANNATCGDGLSLTRVLSTNSRRNNMSVICHANLSIVASTFSGATGTSPQDGIDLEPNHSSQSVRNVSISGGTKFVSNAGNGLSVFTATANIVNVSIAPDTYFENNTSWGISINGAGVTGYDIGGIISSNNNVGALTITGTTRALLHGLKILPLYGWPGSGWGLFVGANNTGLHIYDSVLSSAESPYHNLKVSDASTTGTVIGPNVVLVTAGDVIDAGTATRFDGPPCATVTIDSTNVAFQAASTGATIALATLPVGAIITGTDFKHSTVFGDGAGAMTDVSVSIGSAGGGPTFYDTAHSIGEATPVAATALYSAAVFKRYTSAAEAINAVFVSTARDFGDGAGNTYLTGGSVTIKYCYVVP